jgi:hypothetical protein
LQDKTFFIHFLLVIKVNSSIYVSKELRTQHRWPFLFAIGDTQQIPYPYPLEKSLGIWTNCRRPNFALGCSSLLHPPLVSPLKLGVYLALAVCSIRIYARFQLFENDCTYDANLQNRELHLLEVTYQVKNFKSNYFRSFYAVTMEGLNKLLQGTPSAAAGGIEERKYLTHRKPNLVFSCTFFSLSTVSQCLPFITETKSALAMMEHT